MNRKRFLSSLLGIGLAVAVSAAGTQGASLAPGVAPYKDPDTPATGPHAGEEAIVCGGTIVRAEAVPAPCVATAVCYQQDTGDQLLVTWSDPSCPDVCDVEAEDVRSGDTPEAALERINKRVLRQRGISLVYPSPMEFSVPNASAASLVASLL